MIAVKFLTSKITASWLEMAGPLAGKRLARAVTWKLFAASLLTVAAVLYILLTAILRSPVTLVP